MRAMQSTPYCLANWTMANVQLVVQRYATKIRVDVLWGVVMSWKIFGGKGDISITCVTVVSGEGVYLLILFLHIFISDLRMLSDSIVKIMTIFQYKYKNNDEWCFLSKELTSQRCSSERPCKMKWLKIFKVKSKSMMSFTYQKKGGTPVK